MEFLAIITAISKLIEVVVPAIQECLETRLERAARYLPPASTFASEGAAAEALIDKAIEMTPKRRFLVRHALEEMKDSVIDGDKVRTVPLTGIEAKRGRRLVGVILNTIDD